MAAAVVDALAQRGVLNDILRLEELGYEYSIEDAQLFVSAVQWLADEGVVRSNAQHQFVLKGDQAIGFTLTSKGYAMLASQYEGDLKLGAAIKQAQSTGNGYANVGELVGGLLGAFTKSVSS